MKNIIKQLEKTVKKDVKHFLTDFDHDVNTITKNPAKKFIHITRKHGTALIQFIDKDSLPKEGERVKYLFSTANREELINAALQTVEYYSKNNPLTVHFFDGNKLVKTTPEEAVNIYKRHINGIINFWEEQHRKQQRRDAEARRQRDEYFKDQAKRKTAYHKAQILEEKYGRV